MCLYSMQIAAIKQWRHQNCPISTSGEERFLFSREQETEHTRLVFTGMKAWDNYIQFLIDR